MQSVKKLWRESASLLIIGRNSKPDSNGFNYKVAVMKRSSKSSHLPSLNVFPGGTLEKVDESTDWLKFYQNLGISKQKFNELTNVKGPRPFIFQRNDEQSIAREISLRICAIRETFEEIGLLLCKNIEDLNQDTVNSKIISNFNIQHWQKEVHEDPKKFFELCQWLNVAPDLWSLYEWSAWLTPAFFKTRFDTAFFLATIDHQPMLTKNENEVNTSMWRSPIQLLDTFQSNEIILTAPQIYELSRLCCIRSIDELGAFSKNRNNKGVPNLFAVNYKTKDKNVSTFPGDDFYPKNPAFNCPLEQAKIPAQDTTAEEFRKKAKNLHRMEYKDSDWRIIMNINSENDHLPVVDYHRPFITAKI